MKTLPRNSKLVLAAAVLTILFASGCERRTPPDTTANPAAAPGASDTTATTPSSAGTADTGSSKTAGTVIDDTVITTKVKTALLSDSDIKGLDVSVVTSSGVVTLSGTVNNQTQIDRAGKIATDVSGVNAVVNNLAIKKQ